jgi:phage/plasmid-associated DNA primase
VFLNGIMDLETQQFRLGIQASDFVTDTIPYAYEPLKVCALKKQFVKDVLLKILNNNIEHLDYFLGLIGFSFIGNPHLEKSIYFCVDKTTKSAGDNGKTFFFDILTTLFPNYVYKTNKSFLEDGNTKTHKQLVMMKGKRLVWADEFNQKKTNAELMKLIGDGLQIENEIMFGTSEIIDIMFKLWILTNHIPNIDAKETAVYNRYKQCSYGSHFDRTGMRTIENPELLQFIADPSLGDLIKSEYANEVFEIVIEYAHKYYKSRLPAIPEQFKKDTEATKMKNDVFATFFEETCIIDNNERVALKALVMRSGLTEKIVKEGMERHGFKYERDLSKMGKDENGKPYKGGYIGFKLQPENDNEDDI